MPCGECTITEIFCNYFERVVGVDASSKHIYEAKKKLPNIEFRKCLIEKLDIEEKFDSIFMLNILEHVINSINILKKSNEIFKKDGILIAYVPNAKADNRIIVRIMGTLIDAYKLSP